MITSRTYEIKANTVYPRWVVTGCLRNALRCPMPNYLSPFPDSITETETDSQDPNAIELNWEIKHCARATSDICK